MEQFKINQTLTSPEGIKYRVTRLGNVMELKKIQGVVKSFISPETIGISEAKALDWKKEGVKELQVNT